MVVWQLGMSRLQLALPGAISVTRRSLWSWTRQAMCV